MTQIVYDVKLNPDVMKKKKLKADWFDDLKISLKKALGMNIILCDSCKYDWRGACHRPERPNAVWCPDYEKRGA